MIKLINILEGTCGYGLDGELGEEPAGPHLLKKKGVKEANAVKGSKVQKFITGHNLTMKGKKYKEIEFETLGVDNSSKMIKLKIIAPKNLFGMETPVKFSTLRRGPFTKTDTGKKVNEKVNPDIKQIYKLLMKYGVSAKETAKMMKKHWSYVSKKYKNSSPRGMATALIGLNALGESTNENLRQWFSDKWVNIGKKKKGGGHPPCGTSGKKRGYAKCVPKSKAANMSKKQKKSATTRKRAAQNKAGRGGTSSLSGGGKKPIRVSTKPKK